MWIDEYVKLQFPLNPDDMRIEEAIHLKHKHIPDSLFRYRSFNKYSKENLMKEQERLSYPSEFNDPFDSGMKINYELVSRELFLHRNMENMISELKKSGVTVSKQEYKKIRDSEDPFYEFAKHVAQFDKNLQGKEEEFAKAISKITLEQIKEMFSSYKVSFQNGYLVMCVSEAKDEVLMWSHYASDHSGFCIEYNFQELGPYNPQSRLLCPAIYTDELFDASHYIMQPFLREDHSFNNLFGIYPSISKFPKWAYEKEWRIVFPLGPNASDDQRFIKVPKPKALYVGAKAKSENIEKLKELAIKKSIPLYQMVPSDNSYELESVLLYDPTQNILS